MKSGTPKPSARRAGDVTVGLPRDLKPELGYFLEMPPASSRSRRVANWALPGLDPVVAMTDELVGMEWRVADLRQELEALGEQPKGRTRKALAEQLAAVFLDEARLAQAVARLSETDRNAYVILLLQRNLHVFHAGPSTDKLWKRLSKSTTRLPERLHKAGLVLLTEDGQMFVPQGLLQRLPQLTLPFSVLKKPLHVAPAVDPRTLLQQIQQLLALLQTETFALQPRLRWKAPAYPYAQAIVCWPPVPSDAEKLKANLQTDRILELLPADPYLDPASLQRWAQVLDVSPVWAEFLYHNLLSSGIILPGSPLVIDEEFGHAWMALTPGEQLGAAYHSLCGSRFWAAWWPHWRSGDIHVRRPYHGYWGLNSLDEALDAACSNLRMVLLDVLAILPHDVWLDLDAVHDLLDELFPTAASHRYLMGLTLEAADGGWSAFLGIALTSLLTGPLHALGFVEVSPSRDAVAAVCIHSLQDVHWGRVREVLVEESAGLNAHALRLVADGTTRSAPAQSEAAPLSAEGAVLEIQTPVPPAFMTFVLRWSRPSGFSRNVVRYALDVSRLHQAFEEGEDLETLIETWQSTAGFDPLSEIVDWWRLWWARYGRVRLYPPQALLQTRDAFTLQEVQAALPNLQASILGIVAPQAALLEPIDVDKVLDALSRQGYMPKESS